jgi:hypothetical protein
VDDGAARVNVSCHDTPLFLSQLAQLRAHNLRGDANAHRENHSKHAKSRENAKKKAFSPGSLPAEQWAGSYKRADNALSVAGEYFARAPVAAAAFGRSSWNQFVCKQFTFSSST